MACRPNIYHTDINLSPAADQDIIHSNGCIEFWYDPKVWKDAMKKNSVPILPARPQSPYSLSWSIGKRTIPPSGGYARLLSLEPEFNVDNVLVSMNLVAEPAV